MPGGAPVDRQGQLQATYARAPAPPPPRRASLRRTMHGRGRADFLVNLPAKLEVELVGQVRKHQREDGEDDDGGDDEGGDVCVGGITVDEAV